MPDPDPDRPALPDPQRDRHVAFPEDTQAPVTSLAAAPVSGRPGLPPDAWAPRSASRDPWSTPAPTWQAPGSPTLTASPTRRPPRRRPPGWLALLLVPPLILGLANTGATVGATDGAGECVSYVDIGSGVSECLTSDIGPDPSAGDAPTDGTGAYTVDVTDSTTVASMLGGKPHVSPVPAAATVLRVEVVSSSAADPAMAGPAAQVDTTADGVSLDYWDGETPHAMDIHLDERPSKLTVEASVSSGSGTVQCRIYADDVLVAVDTSHTKATCSPVV